MRGERGLSRLCPECWASPSQSRQRSEATDGPESTLRPRKRHRPHERKTCPQQMMQSLLQTSNLLHFPTCTPCRGTDFSEVGVFNATSFLSRVVVGTNDGMVVNGSRVMLVTTARSSLKGTDTVTWNSLCVRGGGRESFSPC